MVNSASRAMGRAHAEVRRLCFAGLDAEELLRQAAERIRRAVPLDLYCMHTHDPASGLISGVVPSEPVDAGVARAALERAQFADAVTPFGWMARRYLAAVALSESTGGKLDRALRYREVMTPLGAAHEVRGVFAIDGEIWGSISAMRGVGSSDFDDRDVALFHRIAPLLAAGLRTATLSAQARVERDGDDTPGVLVLDRAGRVREHTVAAERLLGDLGELGPGWRDGVGLPAAVSSVAGALEQALGPGADGGADAVPRLLVQARSGRWLALHGARTEEGTNRGGETVIVIEIAGPREVAWLKTAAYGLTKRERDVVGLVVRGASTRQIAGRLFISEYTVQEHLSHIFEKVGERGRRALVKRLYLDGIF